jgi:hypothetical protein
MTRDADFKALIRSRMVRTGERYATARAALASRRLPGTAREPLDDLHPSARAVIGELLGHIDARDPDLVVGFAVVGSLAYGDYKPGKSDVDFVAIVSRSLTDADLALLRDAHRAAPTRPLLDGIYVTTEQLAGGAPTVAARVHTGVLVADDEYGATPVTRRELATIGRAVRGPSPSTLEISNETGDLQRWVRQNLDTYWADWVSRASGFSLLAVYALLPTGIEWCVLGTARMLHTLVTGEVTSKTDVARWALEHVDERYHEVLRTAADIRQGRFSNPLSTFERKAQALAFMTYVVQTAPDAPTEPPLLS